jgi:hypothetical protein
LTFERRREVERLALPAERLPGEVIVTRSNCELRISLSFSCVRGLMCNVSHECCTAILERLQTALNLEESRVFFIAGCAVSLRAPSKTSENTSEQTRRGLP